MYYTEHLLLRPVDLEADVNGVSQRLNDTEFMHFILDDAHRLKSRDGVRKMIENRIKTSEESRLPFLIICLKPERSEEMPGNLNVNENFAVKPASDGSGKVVARYPMIGLLNIRNPNFSFSNRCVRLGLGIDRAHRGKGFGTEVMLWAEEYVFDALGLHRLELEVDEDNLPALKCYEKVGFVKEGTRRQAKWWNGRWKNSVLMAILAEDWRAARDLPAK